MMLLLEPPLLNVLEITPVCGVAETAWHVVYISLYIETGTIRLRVLLYTRFTGRYRYLLRIQIRTQAEREASMEAPQYRKQTWFYNQSITMAKKAKQHANTMNVLQSMGGVVNFTILIFRPFSY